MGFERQAEDALLKENPYETEPATPSEPPKSEKQQAIDRYTAREREILAKLVDDQGNATLRQELENIRKYRKQIREHTLD